MEYGSGHTVNVSNSRKIRYRRDSSKGFIDIISYLHLVTGEKFLMGESQKDEVHAAKFINTK